MNIGSVKAIPRPDSKSIGDAIGLLTALGKEGGENQALLQEMKEVQLSNEETYQQVNSAITENSRLVAEANRVNTEERDRINEENFKLKSRLLSVKVREDLVKNKESELREKIIQDDIERANIESRLLLREERLKKRENHVDYLEMNAANQTAKAAQDALEYKERSNRLEKVKSDLALVLKKSEEV